MFGLDFRDISRLEGFCLFVEQTYDRLDILINNACQTVRRPPAYYSHLVEKEETYHSTTVLKSLPMLTGGEETTSHTTYSPAPSVVNTVLENQNRFLCAFYTQQANSSTLLTNGNISESSQSSQSITTSSSTSPAIPLSSAQMSQLAFLEEEKSSHLNPLTLQQLFPLGRQDLNNQQVDLRTHNSWTMKLHEVSTVELAEVFAINAIAPTILNARLKPLMIKTKPLLSVTGKKNWKFIVNVSAMEGKFYRYKSSNHPHTNMAKAALNMMTRTSAQDYIKDGIYMTAVDTGWINDEKPIEKAMKHEEKHNFQTPLDEIDAAARVLDPVIGPIKSLQDSMKEGCEGIELVEPPWGHFIKDFMKSEW